MTRRRPSPDLEPLMTIDIDAIRKRLDAATPGPWQHDGNDGLVWPERIGDPVSGSNDMADADFIAAARQDIPALCDEIEQLRAIVARSEYRYGDQFCVEGECDHAAETDENAAEGAPCPLVETRYATADDVIELDKVRAQLTAANHRADGLAADLRSATRAKTEHANENQRLREQVFAQKPVIEAAQAWAELHEESDVRLIRRRSAAPAVANLYDAVEQYRLMDAALTSARAEQPAEVAR